MRGSGPESEKSACWSPFSPGLKWPLRAIGGMAILGFVLNWLHVYFGQVPNADHALWILFTGLSLFSLSFRKPQPRPFTKANRHLEWVLGLTLLVGLGVIIFVAVVVRL